MMHMHAPVFCAAMQGGNHLARVKQARGIKGQFYFAEMLQLGLLELCAHLVDFLDTDAVLTCNRATHFHTQLQYLATQFFGTMKLAWLACIVQNQRMQISIASMKHVGHTQTIFL